LNLRVFGIADPYTADDRVLWGDTPVTACRSFGPKPFHFSPELTKTLAGSALDLLHVHGASWIFPSIASLTWQLRFKRPYIVTPHGGLNTWALHQSALRKRLAGMLYENAHLSRADCLHALCPNEARGIRQYGLRNPICVIPNCVDLPPQRAEAPRPECDGGNVLLYLGRLHPKKGLDNLVRAWAALRRNGSNSSRSWRLVIAGFAEGDYADLLKRLCAESGIDDTVMFIGPQYGAEKDSLFRGAAAFILPSFGEGLPMAVLEAWSYGLPVLMTAQANLAEGFEEGAALLIETNPESIARTLDVLFSLSDKDRIAMGQKGRDLVERRFSPARVASEMKAVYDWLASGRPRPACVTLD
jgi:poly(glycerol-phosphate) alpha-glucosyltransferase